MNVEYIVSCVGPGWKELLTNLCNDLIEAGFTGKVLQVKEKFGTLRFYASGATEEQRAMISAAEHKSATISEYSGMPGKVRDTGWSKCLDDDEWAEYQKAGNLSFLHTKERGDG